MLTRGRLRFELTADVDVVGRDKLHDPVGRRVELTVDDSAGPERGLHTQQVSPSWVGSIAGAHEVEHGREGGAPEQPANDPGTLAQIISDPALYQELVTTLRETRALVSDIPEVTGENGECSRELSPVAAVRSNANWRVRR